MHDSQTVSRHLSSLQYLHSPEFLFLLLLFSFMSLVIPLPVYLLMQHFPIQQLLKLLFLLLLFLILIHLLFYSTLLFSFFILPLSFFPSFLFLYFFTLLFSFFLQVPFVIVLYLLQFLLL